jgi:hypothetical protein
MAACLDSQELNPEEMGVWVGTSGGPYGRCRSETGQRTEEAAERPEDSCRVTRRAKGTDPRRLWIPEDVGCRLQDDDPLCQSGLAQEVHSQKRLYQDRSGTRNLEDGRSGGDVSRKRNAARAYGAEMLRSRYNWLKEGKPPTVSEDGAEDSSHDWKVWETVTSSSGKPLDCTSGSEQPDRLSCYEK